MGVIGSLVLFQMRDQAQHARGTERIAAIVCCEPVEDLNGFRRDKPAPVEPIKGLEKIREFDSTKGIHNPLVQPGSPLVKGMV
jgi:hypothetical protein